MGSEKKMTIVENHKNHNIKISCCEIHAKLFCETVMFCQAVLDEVSENIEYNEPDSTLRKRMHWAVNNFIESIAQ